MAVTVVDREGKRRQGRIMQVLGFMGLRREPDGRGFALAGAWINGLILAFWTVATIIVIFAVVAGAIAIPLFAS